MIQASKKARKREEMPVHTVKRKMSGMQGTRKHLSFKSTRTKEPKSITKEVQERKFLFSFSLLFIDLDRVLQDPSHTKQEHLNGVNGQARRKEKSAFLS